MTGHFNARCAAVLRFSAKACAPPSPPKLGARPSPVLVEGVQSDRGSTAARRTMDIEPLVYLAMGLIDAGSDLGLKAVMPDVARQPIS